MEISRVLQLVHDRTGKIIKKSDIGLIQYRIRWKGKTVYISTGIHVKKNQWDKRTQTITKHTEADELNARFIQKRRELKTYLYDDDNRSIEQVKNFVKGHTSRLADYLDNYLSSIKNKRAASTVTNYDITIRKIKKWRPGATLKEVDRTFVKAFEKHLFSLTAEKKTTTLSRGTISRIMSEFKTMITEAVEDELIEKDPFRKYDKIKIKNKDRKKAPLLTDMDIERLEKLILVEENEKLEKFKEVFLFSCFTFLPFADLKSLRVSHVSKKIEEFKGTEQQVIRIRKTRVKSDRFGKEFFLPLTKMPTGPKAIPILLKHMKGKSSTALIFPFVSHLETYHRALRKIAIKAGVSVVPTSHSGRQYCSKWYKHYTRLTNDEIGKMSCQSSKVVATYAGNENNRLEYALEQM